MTIHKILVGSPSGGTIGTYTAAAIRDPSDEHVVTLLESSHSCCNHNLLWREILKAGVNREYDRAAILHADVRFHENNRKWLDILSDEMDSSGADVVAAAIPFKDARGLLTTAIGNPDNWWTAFRRLTMTEMADLPNTFGSAEMGYPGMPLLVNFGAIIFNLESPIWYEGRKEGGLAKVYFEFREEVRWVNGEPVHLANSEDWVFSRMMWEAGLKVKATKALKLSHIGNFEFPNFGDWGTNKHDEETAYLWKEPQVA